MELLNIGSSTETRYLLSSTRLSSVFDVKDYKKKKLTQYYESVHVTNSNIYLLYSGAKAKRVYTNPVRIQVLEWDGHPKAQYLIPAKYKLSEIDAVDKKNRRFYGISFPNDAIYKFNYGSAKAGK